MKQFIKQFFAVDNAVNENTVMGVIFSACLIVSTFIPVTDEKYYILAGLVAVMFGVGAFKR
jgi:hypothetical protein